MTDDKTLPVDESCARSYLTTAVHDLAAMDTVAFELARNKEAERLGITSDELKRAVVAARKTIQADSEPTTSESSPGISPTELEAEVRKLAELDPVKFELSRESEAQRLGVSGPELSRAVTAARRQIDKSSDTKQKPVLFEETVTWDGPIDAGSLFDEMLALVQRFAICEQPYAVTAVLWCAMTWFMQHLRVAPFAMITAPTLACGKSVMLEIMSLMSRRAFMASSTSEAVLFRLIDRDQISLFLDESDRAISPQRQELIGVLNASYTQRFAVTSRCVGDDHEPRTFSTWGPKAFAGIGGLEDTLRSRSVPIVMRRKLAHERTSNIRKASKAIDKTFATIRRKLAKFASEIDASAFEHDPQLPAGLENRGEELWIPLCRIADLVGGRWPELARQAAANSLASQNDVPTTDEELLHDVCDAFRRAREDFLTTEQLINELCSDPEAPWAGFSRGQPITPRQIAKRLRAFGGEPHQKRIGEQILRGYSRSSLADAFNRYGRPAKSATSATPGQEGGVLVNNFVSVAAVADVSVPSVRSDKKDEEVGFVCSIG